MNINPEQEYPIVSIPDTPFWSENIAQLITDNKNGISILFSSGALVNNPTIWRENISVTLPDGEILVVRNFGNNNTDTRFSASLSRFEVTEIGKTLNFSYDGPAHSCSFSGLMKEGAISGKVRRLKINLQFNGTAPVWDMHEGHDTDDPTGIAGAMHIEQLGRNNGTIQVDDKEYIVNDAQTCRDHSRGPRDMTNYKNHCWINGAFASGRGIQMYVFKMLNIDGIAMSKALITENGKMYPATVEQIEFVESRDDFGKQQTIILNSELGKMEIHVKQVLSTTPVSITSPFNMAMGIVNVPHALIFDESVQFEWNGEVGLGWSERGFSKQPI